MITSSEIARSVYGAWRLARLDANGMRYFDGTEGAFWRSFFAAALVLPAYVVLVGQGETWRGDEIGPGRLFAIEAISYVISWTAFPLAAFYVVTLMDRGGRYFAYIAAYNWAQVIEISFLLLLSFIGHLFGADGLAPTLSYLVLGVIMLYEWFIARSALNVNGFNAFGLVVIGFVIMFFLHSLSTVLMHAGA
ncbi:MAG: hypothetical protein QNJ94_20690 [Alphaproteobacteria bacterium]|nr:hypothetical protein [Alphaproteobacteria bacterium]